MVRINVNAGLDISEDVSAAIIAATIGYVLDEDVSVVQVDGSALHPDLPKGLAEAAAGLQLLAQRWGKELIVTRRGASSSPRTDPRRTGKPAA